MTLVGEAYFSVKHDPAHPFIVSVSHDRLRVKVLGTEFNVRAYEKENVVQTTLVSGSVNIVMKEDKGKTNERNLYPSEKAVYDLTDKTLEVINVDVESEIAWKEGRLVFKETPLPEVLRCLANFYNVDFKVMDPVLDSYRLTGTFNNRQLSQILDYLRISSRIDYSIKRMEMDDSLSAQREQVVLEPPPAIVGQPQRDHIIDDEHHPDHVDDGFTQRDMRAGENFPRIHHQKHHGQHHQRPVRPLLPRLQSHIPIVVARPLRHCGA